MFSFWRMRRYKSTLRRALRRHNQRLPESVREELEAYSTSLGVTRDEQRAVRAEVFHAAAKPIFRWMKWWGELSPDEETKLLELAAGHNISAQLGPDVRMYRSLYDLRTKGSFELRSITPSVHIDDAEVSYHEVHVAWLQPMKFREYVGSTGLGLSVPIGGGVRMRVGSSSPIYNSYTALDEKDRGTLVITNKRLVFVGALQSTSTPLKKITQFDASRGRLWVHKDRGKPDAFAMDRQNLRYVSAMLPMVR